MSNWACNKLKGWKGMWKKDQPFIWLKSKLGWVIREGGPLRFFLFDFGGFATRVSRGWLGFGRPSLFSFLSFSCPLLKLSLSLRTCMCFECFFFSLSLLECRRRVFFCVLELRWKTSSAVVAERLYFSFKYNIQYFFPYKYFF